MQRFFYISNVFDENVKQHRSIRGDSPAASGKVIRLCRAVRQQGGEAIVISLGRGRQRGSWKWYPSVIQNSEGVPIIYAAYFDAPILTHIVSIFSLFFILFKKTRRDSVLIFYNFLAYYIPTLIVNRLMGRRCILDIEDGCRNDEITFKGRLNFFLLKLHNLFCNGGVMLASSSLIDQTSLRPAIVCYGVIPIVQCHKNWHTSKIQVLFGGALLKETGAELFLNTLNLLAKNHPDIISKLKIVVTGFGKMSVDIREKAITQYKGFVEFRGSVSDMEYVSLLHKSHVGLCLKLPDMSMGSTTFPSKVVEMAAFGLLIVSTKVSDVPLLFSENSGVLLEKASPEDLASVLSNIVESPEKYRKIALQGQKQITSLLSHQKVGSALKNFWEGS